MKIKLNQEEISKLISHNSILIEKLNTRLKELDITLIDHDIEPTETTGATLRVIQDEVWGLMNQLKTNQRLIAENQ